MSRLPMLSTAFSNDAKNAKIRFFNILNNKNRKNILLPFFIIASIILFEILVSCTANNIETETHVAPMIYDAEITDTIKLYSDKGLIFEKGEAFSNQKIKAYSIDENVCYITTDLGIEGFTKADNIILGHKTETEHSSSSIYPIVYDYVQNQLEEYMGNNYDNIYVKAIGTKGSPLTFNESTEEFEYKCNIKLMYTEKTQDTKKLEYIKNAFESADSNSFTYYDGEELFNHVNIHEIIINFKLKGNRIDNSSVKIKKNIGQIVHTMPIQNPNEEWIEINSCEDLLQDMGRTTYSKELVEQEKINYIEKE